MKRRQSITSVGIADETKLVNITGGLAIGIGADAGVTGSVTVNEIDNFVWARALGDNTLNAADGGVRLSATGKVEADILKTLSEAFTPDASK